MLTLHHVPNTRAGRILWRPGHAFHMARRLGCMRERVKMQCFENQEEDDCDTNH